MPADARHRGALARSAARSYVGQLPWESFCMRLRRLAIPAAACFGLIASADLAGATDLAAHRAVYNLKLESAHGDDVTAASGTMAYEVQDACDGWAVRQRLQMTLTNRDGQDIQMLSDYTTWESKDGLKLRFRMKQTTDQAVTSDLAGDAALTGAGKVGSAHFTSPEDSVKDLPAGTLFPMAHTSALLHAAAGGKKFIALPLFDGTSAVGAQDSSIVVTNWSATPVGTWPDLKDLPSGKFHLAFFDRSPDSQQPDYEVSMRYWDNGVADDLAMNFGDFVMAGRMAEFTVLPKGC
jgi:EipB-like